MKQALLILGSAVIIIGFVAFLYFFGGTVHAFSLHFDTAGEQLTFPEPPELVYKAVISVAGILSCPGQLQIKMDDASYLEPVVLPAGPVEAEVYNGDWYAGAQLGLVIKPRGEDCPDNRLEVKVVYYD